MTQIFHSQQSRAGGRGPAGDIRGAGRRLGSRRQVARGLRSLAENDGELVLRIAPLNGTPIDVTTQVTKNMTENKVADLLKAALKTQLGKGYKVEVDDGEDVLIKKSGKTPKFVVTLVSSSVTGLEIKIRHD
jgi:phosphomannomutase